MAYKWIAKAESIRLFGENEAWWLFKTAALAEAAGWTVLLIGIAYRHYLLPGYRYAVPIAGQFHGTIFLAYFGIVIVLYPSLRWSRSKALIALACGIPPYGTLVFEQFTSRSRAHERSQRFASCVWYSVLSAQAA